MLSLEIEIAIIKLLNPRINIIVPNVSWGLGLHECDILMLTPAGYATEVEIKVSRSDLLADKKKKHQHQNNHLAYLYFAVPEKLEEIALKKSPERAGLYIVKNYYALRVKNAKRNKNCNRWKDHEKFKLAHLGTMRILGLKNKIANNQIHF